MGKPKTVDPNLCIGYKMSGTTSEITSRDAILYALGVGYSKDPLNQKEL